VNILVIALLYLNCYKVAVPVYQCTTDYGAFLVSEKLLMIFIFFSINNEEQHSFSAIQTMGLECFGK
jgi:dTDP-D-glucose 4,6-dehydratase